jgi:glutamate-1-semialdehyde aminotransferase
MLVEGASKPEPLPWGLRNLKAVEARLAQGDVAAVIMEPAMCNTSAILPSEGYLEGVRKLCDETGTILIFDEVITGFRVAPGGVQSLMKVTPDMAVFGKAIANGMPVAAFAAFRNPSCIVRATDFVCASIKKYSSSSPNGKVSVMNRPTVVRFITRLDI